MAGNVLYGMAPCSRYTGVTFDAENDRPGPGSLRGVTFDAENDRPGLGNLRGHFEAAQGRFFETKCFVGHKATGGPPQELAALGIQG